jgi:hypothetical protein
MWNLQSEPQQTTKKRSELAPPRKIFALAALQQ